MTSPPSSSTFVPTPSQDRLDALDVLRGFALIGICIANVEFFNRPVAETGNGIPAGLHGLDWLVAIGGDDTLSYAERLSREGVKVLAVPKTMDNDVFGTDYCIGFSTAVTRSVQFIHQLRTSTG